MLDMGSEVCYTLLMMMSTATTTPATKPTHLSFDVVTIAKMVRLFLKKFYPETKFSVTTDRFSMGSSVDVKVKTATPQTPSDGALWSACRLFQTRGFDGMTDSTTHNPLSIDGMIVSMDSWVHPSNDRMGTVEVTPETLRDMIDYRDTLVMQFANDARAYRY